MITKSLLIVGGGIAGIEAAISASKNMDNILLVESNKELGGYLKYMNSGSLFESYYGIQDTKGLIESEKNVLSKTNVEVMTSTYVSNITREKEQYIVTLVNTEGVTNIKARMIIDAAGSCTKKDGTMFISGLNKAGVFSYDQLYMYITKYSIVPVKKCVLYSEKSFDTDKIEKSMKRGIRFTAYVSPNKINNKEYYLSKNIKVYEGAYINSIGGLNHVESVTIKDANDHITITEVDSLIIINDSRPDTLLSEKAGCEINPYSYGPMADQTYMSSLNGFFFAGDSYIITEDTESVIEQSREVGYNASKYRIVQRNLLNVSKSLNLKYVSPNYIDLNSTVTFVTFHLMPNEYFSSIKDKKIKIYIDGVLKETREVESEKKPVKVKLDLSIYNLKKESSILFTME